MFARLCIWKINSTVVTLVAMVGFSGYCGNCGVTFLWLCNCSVAIFLGAYMILGKKVRRSFHPSPYFSAILTRSISIFHHSTSHSSISLTFNFSHRPLTLCPFPTLICLPQYISQPLLLFPLPVHIPLISHCLICFAIHLFSSPLCSSDGFCLPTSPFLLSPHFSFSMSPLFSDAWSPIINFVVVP